MFIHLYIGEINDKENYFHSANKGKKFYADLQQEVLMELKWDELSAHEKKSVDFKELWEINPEVYAWIEMYGHNMRNGTMFADLHKYEDAVFLQENPYIYIYTPDNIYTYEIFAAVVHNDRHLMYAYDFSTEAGRQEYLDAILTKQDERNQYRDSVELTADNQMLVLSTCVSGESDKRYLVNAVLVDKKYRYGFD